MKNQSGRYPVKKMADTLGVSRSRYYRWQKISQSRHEKRDMELGEKIRSIYHSSRKSYGSPRVYRELRKQTPCSRKRVARIMRENGLRGRVKRRFRVTTDSNHGCPVSANLLDRDFNVAQPNQVWVSDITYIWTGEGWLYLCVIIDLFSRKVVGWSLASHIRAELVIMAFMMAVMHRSPGAGLIFHSDQGIQYASEEFRKKLSGCKMIQSMSRKGDCWDNACAESFFSTIKIEEIFQCTYRTREEARTRIFEYIAVFYNRQRIHSTLDYMSPQEYENQRILQDNVA